MKPYSYYLTFGQTNPLKNGYIKIIADSYEEARQRVIQEFGLKWAGLYNESESQWGMTSEKLFPDGCYSIIDISTKGNSNETN